MLATAADVLPRGVGWAYEFKWDGVRALVDVSARGVQLFSRARQRDHHGLSRAGGHAARCRRRAARRRDRRLRRRRALVRGAAGAHARAGEDRSLAGWPRHAPVTFVAFDLLRRRGEELTGRPYRERRAALEAWFAEEPELDPQPVLRRRTGHRGGRPSARARRRRRETGRLAVPARVRGPGTGSSCASCAPATSWWSGGRRRPSRRTRSARSSSP